MRNHARGIVAFALLIVLAACGSPTPADTTSPSPSSAPTTALSPDETIAPTTSVTSTSTTVGERTYDFEVEIWLYDAFESATDELKFGEDCFGTANAVSFRRGGRV